MIWNEKKRQEYMKEMGVKQVHIAGRRSGRSTLNAFEILVFCYSHPGVWIKVQDHAEHYAPRASRYLFDTMKRMAFDLGYFQLEFNHNRLEVRLNIDIEEPKR